MRSVRFLFGVAAALVGVALIVAPAAPAAAQAGAKKRILLVTHSGGFIHSSVVQAEKTLKELGEKNNFEVVCFRFTNDPARKTTVTKKVDGKDEKVEVTSLQAYSGRFKGSTREEVTEAHSGRLNAETLKSFDAVFFFTTGNPVESREEQAALLDFVMSGKGFLGTHCATDTLYGWKEYGEMIGGYFNGHPWTTKVKIVVEDSKNPLVAHLGTEFEINDEIYQHRDPYSRDKLRILMRLDPAWLEAEKARRGTSLENSRKNLPTELPKREAAAKAKAAKIIADAETAAGKLTADGKEADAKKALAAARKAADAALAEPENYRKSIENGKATDGGARKDGDYAMAWCRNFGKGRVFYTALGHREEVWKDPRFQTMIIQAIKWTTGQIEADATPSGSKGAQ
jgi:type 1 glutamine amidotransferase